MSKKATLGAIAAASVVAYGAGTWFCGNQVRSTYDHAFDELPKQLALVRVVERSYDRSFMGAVSTVTLEIGCAPDNAAASAPAQPAEPVDPDDEEDEEDEDTRATAWLSKPVRITLRDTIHHGPIAGGTLAAAVIDSELVLDPQRQAEAKKIFGGAAPMTARTRVGFDGGYASDITVAAARWSEAGKSELTWQGATAHVAMDGTRTRLQYDLALPGLEFDAARGLHAKMGRLTLKADTRRGEDWMLATGTSEGRLDRLELEARLDLDGETDKSVPKVVLQNIDMHGEADTKDGLYGSSATVKGQGSLGAAKFDRFEFTSGARRIQATGYRKIAEAWLRSNAAAGCAKGGAKASRAAQQALMDRLAPDLKAMARFNPEGGIDRMVVEMSGQRGELSYSAGLAGVTDEDLQLPGSALLAKRGVLKADARLPVKWVEQLAEAIATEDRPMSPKTVATLIEQGEVLGFLKRDGDAVTGHVEFSEGALKVNGQPLNRLGK